jgi:hypothetical protein
MIGHEADWDELVPDAYDDPCDGCGDPAATLEPVEVEDRSVGYRETVWLCDRCFTGRQ